MSGLRWTEGDAVRPQAAAYAALDLGTNNCRLLIGVPTRDGFRVVDSYSRIVRLGEGLHHTGELAQSAMDRAMAALRTCADRIGRRELRGVRAVATEACRRATNGAAFLDLVRSETGIEIRTISTREEAELALESCSPLLAGAGRRALLFDIGGGSTELAWVRLSPGCPPELIGYISLPVGVVTLSERWGAAAFTADGFEAMVQDVMERLQEFERVYCIAHEIRQGGVQFLGTSGTVTTLAGISLKLDRYRRDLIDGISMTRDAVDDALIHARELGRSGLSSHPCIGADRVEYVLPGCAIFAAIHELWPTPTITVADRGLREGLLLRMMRAARA